MEAVDRAAATVAHGLVVEDRVRVWVHDPEAVAEISRARGRVEPVAHDLAVDNSIGRKAIGRRTEICQTPVALVRAFSAQVAVNLRAVQARARTLVAAPERVPALVRDRAVGQRKDN